MIYILTNIARRLDIVLHL